MSDHPMDQQPTGPAPPPRRGLEDDPILDPDDHGPHDQGQDHHDYVDLPGEGSLPKWAVVSVAVLVIVGLLVGGGWLWWNRQLDPPGSPGAVVSVEVPSGASVSGIGSLLESRGVIPNAMVFNIHAGRKNAGPFQAGVYHLRKNSDVDSVLTVLARGPSQPLGTKTSKVSIPEGLTVAEIIDKIAEKVPSTSAEEMQAAVDGGEVQSSLRPSDQPSYEGLLFPATYEVDDETSGPDLLDQMAAEMETRVGGLDVDDARAQINSRWGLDLTTYDLMKVASMIQSEAGNPDEAPKIATVIYNRLAQGIPLGIDAVDQYGAELAGSEVDFTDSSLPYNTRRRAGLPPTPISAPGDFALSAAFNPAEGDWLYYVLVEPRVHTFVVTNSEFLEAKRLCRQRGLGCG